MSPLWSMPHRQLLWIRLNDMWKARDVVFTLSVFFFFFLSSPLEFSVPFRSAQKDKNKEKLEFFFVFICELLILFFSEIALYFKLDKIPMKIIRLEFLSIIFFLIYFILLKRCEKGFYTLLKTIYFILFFTKKRHILSIQLSFTFSFQIVSSL